ncbi:MAG: hypothetical protein NW237_07830 [Cyanobacteriota bacterium]|nr:hypothetical protein [Cyanobacteriota bacterium]
MAIVFVSSNKLADFLKISLEQLKQIEEEFDRIPDDKWELIKGKDYRVVNKVREYTQTGAHAIYLYLKAHPDFINPDPKDIKKWFVDKKKHTQRAFVDHKILGNSTSLIRRQDDYWLSVSDVIAILGTRRDYFNKIIKSLIAKNLMIQDIHYTRFAGSENVYISRLGIYNIAIGMRDLITQANRKEWCRDVAERISPQIDLIIKQIEARHKEIEWAKKLAKKRDKNLCKVTRMICHSLTVHHLYSEAYYPKIAASLSNLITLSSEIHNHFHQWMGGTNKPCTIEDFINYIFEYYPEHQSLLLWLEQQKVSLGSQQPVGSGSDHVLYLPLKRITENH